MNRETAVDQLEMKTLGSLQKSKGNVRTNQEWIEILKSPGHKQSDVIRELQAYLYKAVYLYVVYRRSDLTHLSIIELEQLADDCSQEAIIRILNKLDTFKGRSRFTTWASKIAMNTTSGILRRRYWKDLSFQTEDENGEETSIIKFLENVKSETPEQSYEKIEIYQILRNVIQKELTTRQRDVLTDLLIQGIPMDVVAERLGTNRNNVYKIMHDARKKLKKGLIEVGLPPDYILSVFSRVESAPTIQIVS
ncbi:MAG: sigma-70 family RNA polymerase sigma factor [Anaerolineales bacterium]|nr:sigma-70 family RNA polymerase sigma factor [Anaerolineales bacterium]